MERCIWVPCCARWLHAVLVIAGAAPWRSHVRLACMEAMQGCSAVTAIHWFWRCRYYASAYYLAKSTAEAFIYVVAPVCFSCIAYWMVGLQVGSRAGASRGGLVAALGVHGTNSWGCWLTGCWF